MKLIVKEDTQLQHDLSEMLEKVSWHGHYFSCLCVFHDNKNTPAMMVYPDKFYCKSCEEFGSLDKLKAKLTGSVIRYRAKSAEEEQEKPDWTGWKKKYGSYEAAAVHAYETGQDYPILMDYIRERGFGSIIKEGYLGYLDGWISFPVFRDGEMVDWIVRSTPTLETDVKYAIRPRFKNEEVLGLYSADWEKACKAERLFVPFGILDMWALHMLGVPVVTGITGKSYNPSWFDDLRMPIYLIPDLGEEQSAYQLKRMLGWRGNVWVLDFPEGTKDCADIMLKCGMSALELELFGVKHG